MDSSPIPRFRTVFPTGHVVLPVVHVVSREQALRNVTIAHMSGANGVFLIGHSMPAAELLAIHSFVADRFIRLWIGVNCLDLAPVDVFGRVTHHVSGVWTDDGQIDETSPDQPGAAGVQAAFQASRWHGLHFGGVAFKYQRPVTDLAAAARIASKFMDVITTSGAGTGMAADLGKIRAMKEALGEFPLAIASGITPANVHEYLPISDCYLVATGISDSFYDLNPWALSELIAKVQDWDAAH